MVPQVAVLTVGQPLPLPSLRSLCGVLLLAEGNKVEHLPNTCLVS